MNRTELHLLYKSETGTSPVDEEEEVIELDVFRSRGQWILNMTDEQVMELREGLSFTRPDTDYVVWLEEKVMELLTK